MLKKFQVIQQNATTMLLLSGGNMFKRKEKELKERIEKLERDVEYWQASCNRMYDKFFQESSKNAALLPTIEKQKNNLKNKNKSRRNIFLCITMSFKN